MKYKLIAYSLKQGKCHRVLTCKDVDKAELDKLKQEEEESIQNEIKEKEELYATIQAMQDKIASLEYEIKVLKGEEDEEDN